MINFFPDEYLASTYVIPFEELYEKGYRGVIFDIDNTLVPHGAPADERAKKLFTRLNKIGFPPAFCQIIRNRVWRCLIRRYRLLISIMLTSLQSRIMRRQ